MTLKVLKSVVRNSLANARHPIRTLGNALRDLKRLPAFVRAVAGAVLGKFRRG